MLQLHQRFMKFSTTNFSKIFRGIIPEKYRYFSGNFRKKIRRKFPEISELTTLILTMQMQNSALEFDLTDANKIPLFIRITSTLHIFNKRIQRICDQNRQLKGGDNRPTDTFHIPVSLGANVEIFSHRMVSCEDFSASSFRHMENVLYITGESTYILPFLRIHFHYFYQRFTTVLVCISVQQATTK